MAVLARILSDYLVNKITGLLLLIGEKLEARNNA
jgi:hypothetical protein